MVMLRGNKIVTRLDEMLTDAINGSFIESVYDETELSRLESKFRQYLTAKEMSEEKVRAERKAIKELVTDISHQTKTPAGGEAGVSDSGAYQNIQAGKRYDQIAAKGTAGSPAGRESCQGNAGEGGGKKYQDNCGTCVIYGI